MLRSFRSNGLGVPEDRVFRTSDLAGSFPSLLIGFSGTWEGRGGRRESEGFSVSLDGPSFAALVEKGMLLGSIRADEMCAIASMPHRVFEPFAEGWAGMAGCGRADVSVDGSAPWDFERKRGEAIAAAVLSGKGDREDSVVVAKWGVRFERTVTGAEAKAGMARLAGVVREALSSCGGVPECKGGAFDRGEVPTRLPRPERASRGGVVFVSRGQEFAVALAKGSLLEKAAAKSPMFRRLPSWSVGKALGSTGLVSGEGHASSNSWSWHPLTRRAGFSGGSLELFPVVGFSVSEDGPDPSDLARAIAEGPMGGDVILLNRGVRDRDGFGFCDREIEAAWDAFESMGEAFAISESVEKGGASPQKRKSPGMSV